MYVSPSETCAPQSSHAREPCISAFDCSLHADLGNRNSAGTVAREKLHTSVPLSPEATLLDENGHMSHTDLLCAAARACCIH